MSTGLTWVAFFDWTSVSPEVNQAPVVFSDYNEALSWAKWYMEYYRLIYAAENGPFRIMVYTTGPNQSGTVALVSGSVDFIVFEG